MTEVSSAYQVQRFQLAHPSQSSKEVRIAHQTAEVATAAAPSRPVNPNLGTKLDIKV